MGLLAEQTDWLDRLHIWLEQNQGLGLWLTGTATVGLAVGVIFAWFAVKDAKRTRHSQLIVDLSRRWDELVTSEQLGSRYTRRRLLELVLQVYAGRPTGYPSDEVIRLSELPSLVETIGVLVLHTKSLTVEIVDSLWGPTIVELWDVWSRPVDIIRRETQEFGTYFYFQKLAAELRQMPPLAERRWLIEKLPRRARRAVYARRGRGKVRSSGGRGSGGVAK